MRNILSIIVIYLSIAFSGTDGTVRGKVVDETGQPMASAQVFIKETGQGTMADLDGNYILLNIPIGKHDVHCMVIGYKESIVKDVEIVMDQTIWLNFSMEVSAVQGDAVTVTSERQMVEKDVTAKKVTMSSESIQSLPIRSASDLYSLQSGVVRVESKAQGIPGHEERGLEEIHVRGGRAGEIAYMIDGMYIRNPIYGGIGSGTRLNLFAISEWDWQPGGFSAEYGDAMSALSNYHTSTGKSEYVYKTKYETSSLGEAIGSDYDRLRNYHDTNIGFGGPVPAFSNLTFWFSGQKTDKTYRVLEFDDKTYNPNSSTWDPLNNSSQRVERWDDVAGFRGFGFDNTTDYFTKLTWKPLNKVRANLSYWVVQNHRKIFDPDFLYWDDGQNELFRDTERIALEVNHSVNDKTFYTVRFSRFDQGQFQGVRWDDSDKDGYPDWFEWRHPAGDVYPFALTEESRFSDPNNSDVVPYEYINGRIEYTNKDSKSGWYYGADPGNYNWSDTEPFLDENFNELYDQGEPFLDANNDGSWDGPVLVEKAIIKDGSYWLTPEMYENYQNYTGYVKNWMDLFSDNPNEYFGGGFGFFGSDNSFHRDYYYLGYNESRAFGGSDIYFSSSSAITNEIRIDATSQLTSKWKLRVGLDYKRHLLEYYEVQSPWSENPFVQEFAEAWDDYNGDQEWSQNVTEPYQDLGDGIWNDGEIFMDIDKDGVRDEDEIYIDEGNGIWDAAEPFVDCGYDDSNNPICQGDNGWQNSFGNGTWDANESFTDCGYDDSGNLICENEVGWLSSYGNGSWDPQEIFEDWNGNGVWDPLLSEPYDDANDNSKWDVGREPYDLSGYIQNTFEVPWMVINAGLRFDYTNFKTRLWANPEYEISPYLPYYYNDAIDNGTWDQLSTDNNGEWDFYDENGNGVLDEGEPFEQFEDRIDDDVYTYGEPFVDAIEPIGTDAGIANAQVLFTDTESLLRLSPRIGFSHVITDQATFTFNYGVYYQNPVFMNIYVNTNNLGDPFNLFQTDNALVGNPSMTPARTESYEYSINIQMNRHIAFNLGTWVKNMDQLTSTQKYRSGTQDYWVMRNYDFGRAQGIDFMVQTRGLPVNINLQYTWSEAKSNQEYAWSKVGNVEVDAPAEEYLMSYDRTHDASISLSTFLPYGVLMSVTHLYQTGAPYTPLERAAPGSNQIIESEFRNSVRMPDYNKTDMSLSKYLQFGDMKISLGLNIYNLFDRRNTIDIYRLTGSATNPGDYYQQFVGLPSVVGGTFVPGVTTDVEFSESYYDSPWNESSAREINAFIRFDFK